MTLPYDLVSDFAKLTANAEPRNKESSAYGTVVEYNGEKYVRLDGSELLTPATFTTNAVDGERVAVTIKNHSVIVTGNTTSPSARGKEVEAVNGAVSNVESTVSNNSTHIKDVMADVESINAMFRTLVTGQNGESLMTQTDSGWVFSMANVQNLLSKLSTDVNSIDAGITDANCRLNSLDQCVIDLGEYTDYIKFGVDNGKPCIILGEADSTFKVMITNTDIRFMEGSVVPASISNQALNIETAVVNDELRQGNFAWVSRSNGHYSLLWKE